jgi:type II secretory pathway pseudopilin PulG
MNYKKGAMFGLDARIALAIFGALSVISGAALYSAIQEAKVVKVLTIFNEFEKSLTAYLLDTGSDIQNHESVPQEKVTLELLESAKAGWKGPYLSAEKDAVQDHFLRPSDTGLIFWAYFISGEDWGNTTSSAGTTCTSGKTCYYFLKTHLNAEFGDNAAAMAAILDERIDGGDGYDKGKLRINWYGGGTSNPIAFYQMMPLLNQP